MASGSTDCAGGAAWAQAPAAQANPAATTARAAAPVDMTGYWVSIITQDWIYRMVVPQRGQYAGIQSGAPGQNAR